MKEKITKLLGNKKASKIILLVGIIGIALIFFSSFAGSSEEETVPTYTEFSENEYLLKLEDDIKQIVYGICGDSSAVVTVTLDTGLVFEYANETKERGAEEQDKSSNESEKTYIIVRDKNGAETPLLITSYMPRVRGVSVICNANETDAEKIKNAVSAALDITLRKIYIGRKISQ